MIFALLTLFTALAVAGVSGWFSIIGVMTIYAGAQLYSALVMGIVLELAKLVTTSWLYRNWGDSSWALKIPLLYFAVALMITTSMGVFGYLSKAHLEQGASTLDNTAKIERIDQQIAREKSIIDDNDKVIAQLDSAITSYIGKDRTDKALSIRRSQAPQRKQLRDAIDASQKKIDEFSDQRLVLTSEIRNVQLEVGPIRYIADLFTSSDMDNSAKIEYAVKLFTLLIVSTLDPLAVTLLIAANKSLLRLQNGKKNSLSQTGTRAMGNPYTVSQEDEERAIESEEFKDDTILAPEVEIPVSVSETILRDDVPTQTQIHDEIPETQVSAMWHEEVNEKDTILQEETTIGQSIWSQIPDYINKKHSSQIKVETEAIRPIGVNFDVECAEAKETVKEEITMPVIREPAVTRLDTVDHNPVPWAHQSSILRELLGTPAHFVPMSIDDNITQTSQSAGDVAKYPKSLSWLKEFKGE